MDTDDKAPKEDKDVKPDTPDSTELSKDTSAELEDAPPQEAPADALSKTPDELAEEKAEEEAAKEDSSKKPEPEVKKQSAIKRFFKRANVYFLLFLLVVVIAAVITVVNYLNSQKEAPAPSFATKEMTEEELKKLANNDASVGNITQTLTIQGNTIIEGQTLMRGDLNVAGNIQTAGSLQGSSLTISGDANLGQTQINSLQVAQDTAIQGSATIGDLSVSGTTSLSGPVTASQLTVSRLILSGNARLEIPNHISFTGPSPSRSINSGVLGGGGSASVNGSDTSGTVNINTGNNPSAGCFVRINFNQQFSNRPHVIISPVGAAAGRSTYYVDRNQSGFSICTATPAPANQSFAFDYFVTN